MEFFTSSYTILILFGSFYNFQILDISTSLAKVADVDRNLANEDAAVSGFKEAIKMLESLTIDDQEVGLEQRV